MANAAVVQLGAWRSSDDTFQPHNASPTNAVLDLNDGVNFSLNDGDNAFGDGLNWNLGAPSLYKASNPRASHGARVHARVHDQPREVTLRLVWGQGSSYTAWQTAIHNLMTLCEGITSVAPAALKVIPTGGTTPFYLDVLAAFIAPKYEELKWVLLIEDGVEIKLTCKPFFRGSRQWLQNLVVNPGFEAPGGPGTVVFNDPLANFNSYSIQAGGALAQDKYTYADAVDAINGAAGATATTMGLLRYYRLDEASGTTAYDASGKQQNGTTHGSPTQGATGLLTGDSDTAYVFAAASSQYISSSTTGLPTGNNPWTLHAVFKTPAAFPGVNMEVVCYGVGVAHQEPQLYIDNAGLLHAATNSGDTTGFALSTSTTYDAAATWDGTTLTLYVNGTSRATATPTALTIPTSATFCSIGATPAASPALFYSGTIDEVTIWSGCMSSTQVATLHTAATTSPTTTANTMLVPSGGREKFGSSTWTSINQWQTRFRYVTGLTGTWYLNYADANDYLSVAVTGTQLAISQDIASVVTSLGTAAMQLVNGVQYWLTITAFPGGTIQATIMNDVAGAIGSTSVATVTSSSTTTVATGPLQIAASGAALGIGGNFSSVHFVALFGPGGWTFTSTGTGTAWGGWDSTTTYPNGPVTSQYAGKVKMAPAGAVNAKWNLYQGSSASTLAAIPANRVGATEAQVLGLAAQVKSSGLSNAAVLALIVTEYLSNGSSITSATATSVTGNQSSWTTLNATYTTQTTCVYADLALSVVDTAASAGGSVWWDNVQVWNQTYTGLAAMPYCELRFSQSPAQLMVSGILGDAPAPAMIALGTYFTNMISGEQMTFALGRRQFVGSATQLAAAMSSPSSTAVVLTPTAYGGFYSAKTLNGWGPFMVPAQTLANGQGTYHGIVRAWTAESALTTVTAALDVQQSIGTIQLALIYGTNLNVFSSASTWTIADLGQMSIPFEGRIGYNGMRNLANITSQSYVQLTDNTGSTTFQVNWGALLPVDGGVVIGTLTNPSNAGANAATWAFVYVDGTNAPYAQLTRSLEASSVPYPANGMGGIGTLTTGFINLVSTADPYLTLDPSLTVAGTPVNQMLGILSDQLGAVFPLTCDIAYSPLYLIPR